MTHKEFSDEFRKILDKKKPGKVSIRCPSCEHDHEINLWEREAIDLLVRFVDEPQLSKYSLSDLKKRITRLNYACYLIPTHSPIDEELCGLTEATLRFVAEIFNETSEAFEEFIAIVRELNPRLLIASGSGVTIRADLLLSFSEDE